MRTQQSYRIANCFGSCKGARTGLAILILSCALGLGVSSAKAEHLGVDLGASSLSGFIANVVLAGRVYPDDFPDIIRDNRQYFHSYQNTIACLDNISVMLQSASLSEPQENIRDRAVETWGGTGIPSHVYDGLPGGGDPRALAAVQFGELARVIPSILNNNDGPYAQTSFYQFTVLGYRYIAQISGYLSIIESMPSGNIMDDWLNEYMGQVVRATLTQMAAAAYKDTYTTARQLADMACP